MFPITSRISHLQRIFCCGAVNFLHALANGVNTGFTQSTVLKQYKLGTAANITRLKKALTEKDLITTIAPKTLAISDPILQMWLKRRVWRE